jgi:hypothetical protein
VASVDKPRYLARGAGYVRSTVVAMDKLECVDAQEQDRQTTLAHRAWQRMMQRRWGKAAQTINGAIEDFSAAGVDQRVARDLRTITRGVRRVSQRLDELGRQARL